MTAGPLPWLLTSALCAVLFAPCARAQDEAADAAKPVATFRLPDGQTATVARGDIALEMAFSTRRKDDGRAACAQLVKTTLVRAAAQRESAWPDPADVRARWDELRQQLRAVGRDIEREPIYRNCGEQALLDYLALDLAHERLVRKELGLKDRESVSPAMLELWVKEASDRTTIVDDPDQLPVGTAVRVGDRDVPMLELGMLLLRSSGEGEQDQFVRQVVVLRWLEELARTAGITVSQEELQREVEQRRAAAEADPRYRGLTYEQLLKANGMTVEWLLRSRVFRGNVLQKKLVAKQHPRAELLRELQQDRAAMLEQYGPQRHIAIVFARALEEPNQLVPRDFAAALTHLAEVRQRLARDPFETVAKIESEDVATKPHGGDCGWQVRRSKGLPEPVLAAAWQLQPGEVSEPVRADDGCYLVKLLGIEPDLRDDAIVDRRLESLVLELTQDLLAKAAITRTDGTSLATEATTEPADAPRNK